jgi:hypothetical protein
MIAVPVLPVSALVMAGISFADERGTVKVDVVVVPCDGAEGEELPLPHPAARRLAPTTSTVNRFMLFCLP